MAGQVAKQSLVAIEHAALLLQPPVLVIRRFRLALHVEHKTAATPCGSLFRCRWPVFVVGLALTADLREERIGWQLCRRHLDRAVP